MASQATNSVSPPRSPGTSQSCEQRHPAGSSATSGSKVSRAPLAAYITTTASHTTEYRRFEYTATEDTTCSSTWLLEPERGRSLYRNFRSGPLKVAKHSYSSASGPTAAVQLDTCEELDHRNRNNSRTLAPSSPSTDFEKQLGYSEPYRDHPHTIMDRKGDFSSSTGGGAAYSYPKVSSMPAVPLINKIRNEWRQSSSSRQRSSSVTSPDHPAGDFAAFVRRLLRRRSSGYTLLAIITLIVLFKFIGSPWSERVRLQTSIRERLKGGKGYFGVNQRVEFANLVHMKSLERWKVPGSGESHDGQLANDRRLIFIGDIHGCADELQELMAKISFEPSRDHLVAVGDMISRGPKSPEVVSYLMKNQASCVRGNHEDRILLAYRDVHSPSHRKTSHSEDGSVTKSIKKGQVTDLELAESLSESQVEYLTSCPAILDVGHIPTMGRTTVVHAGLVPALPLENQDPSSVMTMRSIDIKTHVPRQEAAPKIKPFHKKQNVVPWADLWNAYQAMLKSDERGTVIYGHDSKRGIVRDKYSWGIDGGCVRGRELAALVVEMHDGKIRKELVKVQCRQDYSKIRKPANEIPLGST